MSNQRLVFVVDDDFDTTVRARLLRLLGYASVSFPSAQAFANHSQFDGVVCILLDIDLGDGSGIELRHQLNATNVSVPVIYMTGNDDPRLREAALQSGCIGYLTKPFSAASLAEMLQQADGDHRVVV